MQLVLFIGLQGAGKSTFYRKRFLDSHIRINLDMLRTRHRERIIFEACLAARQSLVVDNTNPTPDERARYIVPARASGFEVVGFYFRSCLSDCQPRNERRAPSQAIPLTGLLSTASRLVRPTRAEGFDHLSYVRVDDANQFVVQEWCDEI